ncbi:MAG: adenylate kinase family protein [Verrucomicrobiia bacterium]
MKYRTILLFGAPGAGKGTQGRILGSIPQFFHCACGDVFRSLRPDNELGRLFVEYSSQGKLVPDDATVKLWHRTIEGSIASGRFRPDQDTVVLDGIPRNVPQAEMLQSAIDVRMVISLVCAEPEKLVQRLQRRATNENRLDDIKLDVIRTRLETYERETQPVLDYYGPRLIRNVNALQTPVNVHRDVLNAMAEAKLFS